ncbi:1577_t:CDS:2, partial [Cetraspora pellucida]
MVAKPPVAIDTQALAGLEIIRLKKEGKEIRPVALYERAVFDLPVKEVHTSPAMENLLISKKSDYIMKSPYPELEIQGVTSKKVLVAIRRLPRELFIAPELRSEAYFNVPLPIACGQTISQPFIVAYMTEKLALKPTDKVLEIGTGSGFQIAVLAQLADQIFTVEIHAELSLQAQKVLTDLGFKNIKYRIGDGKLGWPEAAPFDKIIVTALAREIPMLLVKQLNIGGQMILPLEFDNGEQYLVLLKKLVNNKIEQKRLLS